jgi:heat shock protein HtpX
VGEGREARADLAGVEMTRYPPGLISALGKLHGAATVAPATRHLWIVEPDGSPGHHPPVEDRVALLREV